MKRGLSDSDSDDGFDDSMTVGSPSQSCQVPDRKRRRGVIEKRRRDRINCSLSELKRLVPSAFEKQGSAKLEKAEILQMTVDHLKLLHHRGLNSYSSDPQHLATDYRHLGFRECATEVARYLVAVEGLDLQDPLRMRLLTHLHCFANKDIVKVATATVAAAATNYQYGGELSSMWSTSSSQAHHHHSSSSSFNAQHSSMMPGAAVNPAGGSFAGSLSSTAGSYMGSTGSGHLGSVSLQGSAGSLGSGHLGSGHLGGVGSLNSGGLSCRALPLQPSPSQPGGTADLSSATSVSASCLINAFSDSCNNNSSSNSCLGRADIRSGGSSTGMVGLGSNSGSTHTVSTAEILPSSSLSSSSPLLHSLSQFHAPPPSSYFPAVGQSFGGVLPPLSTPHHPTLTYSHSLAPTFTTQQTAMGGVKPHRPWGGELAY